MIGARHSAGSAISNGGVNSLSNWVILGREPRAQVRRIEDDRCPPLCRLRDLERGRQFAVQLGHTRAPSLKSAAWTDRFGQKAHPLSIIETDLPSEKSLKRIGTVQKRIGTVQRSGKFRLDCFARHSGPKLASRWLRLTFTRNLLSEGLVSTLISC